MAARLGEFDKTEWHDIIRKLRPDWSDERFETAWNLHWALKEAAEVREREAAPGFPVSKMVH
jgi:hypothetical protein